MRQEIPNSPTRRSVSVSSETVAAPAGGARLAACAAWLAAVGAALVATAPDAADAVAALVPAAVVVLAWAMRPWRVLRRRVPARASATLRTPTA